MFKIKKIFLFLIISVNLHGQPAKEYYALLEKAEASIITGDLNDALIQYESAFNTFNYPFYKHVKQAAIIAHYANENDLLEKFLIKCIEKGMNKNELSFFETKDNLPINIKRVIYNYNTHRSVYGSNLDTLMLLKFIELDVLDQYVNEISYENNRYSENNRLTQDSLYIVLMARYFLLISEFGFPTEEKVGLDRIIHLERYKKYPKDWENTFKFQIAYNTDLLLKEENTDFWTNENFGKNRTENSRPGNRFLYHFAISTTDYIEDRLIALLQNGIDNLKINPEVIMHHLELREWVKGKKNSPSAFDCGCSYWSIAFVNKARSVYGMAKLSKKDKEKINECRMKYYTRSLEVEEQLFYALYYLEFGEEPKKYNKKYVNKISYTFNAYI